MGSVIPETCDICPAKAVEEPNRGRSAGKQRDVHKTMANIPDHSGNISKITHAVQKLHVREVKTIGR